MATEQPEPITVTLKYTSRKVAKPTNGGPLKPAQLKMKPEQLKKGKLLIFKLPGEKTINMWVQVTAKPTLDSLLKAKRLKKGTLIAFKSAHGGDLDLKLEPESAFKPHTFKSGQRKPVLVTKELKKVDIWCGGRFVANYEDDPRKITIRPQRNQMGLHGDGGN
jgi:hypothetical protein